MDVRWDSQGYFKPNLEQGSDPFVISMPPPNVTGSLHMGHAMFVTLEVVEMVSEHLIHELIFLLYCHTLLHLHLNSLLWHVATSHFIRYFLDHLAMVLML